MTRFQTFLILAVSYFLASLVTSQAFAMVAYETSPGVIEVRGRQDLGLVVTKVQSRKVGKRQWVYFCVTERSPTKVQFSRSPKQNEKCFYGDPKLFSNVREGALFRSVEYGLRNRIFNGRGLIAIGSEKYFYPAYVLYSLN